MTKVAAIIPTRNRARYAMNAVRSLLDQDSRIDIFVSDNSSSTEPLREHCSAEPHVTYMRPDRELPMGAHWDWAIRRAMALSDATHFTIHYDRKLSKPASWDRLTELASRQPGQLITFTLDIVSETPPPLRIWQVPWTGRLFAIDTSRVADAIAAGTSKPLAQSFPVLSNCLVPRQVLESLVERFGNVCQSIGPDSAFLTRFLTLHERYFHHDRAQGIVYGSTRSNGGGYARGKGGDFQDFAKLSGEDVQLHAAPLPGVHLGFNMLYHDYELVRRETGDRLPQLDREAILRDLADDLRWKIDPREKARLRKILVEQGWNGPEPAEVPLRTRSDAKYERTARRRMKENGEIPPCISGFTVRSDEEGLLYALRYPRLRQEANEQLEALGFTEIAS